MSRLAVSLLLAGCTATPSTIEPEPTPDPLSRHDGYWLIEADTPDGTLIAVNDLHADLQTQRSTVYAQTSLDGVITAPPQVGPDDCLQTVDGDPICHHPNAVYLDGSGEELLAENGRGSWWVKHSWIMEGEGYFNCELTAAQEVYTCLWAEAEWEPEGLTMRIATRDERLPIEPYNRRILHVDQTPVQYEVARYLPTIDPETGVLIDAEITHQMSAFFECADIESAFDGRARPCPQ